MLNPHPNYSQLQKLAGHDKVIYVAVGYETDDRRIPEPPNKRHHPHSKLAITQAILQNSLASTFIVGTTLAKDLLDPSKAVKD